jgi:hypothetical protein
MTKPSPYLRPFGGPFRRAPFSWTLPDQRVTHLVMTEDREAGRTCLEACDSEQAAEFARQRLSKNVTKPRRQKCWIETYPGASSPH